VQYRERGNRCEGFYRAKVASETIEIVGVTEGKFLFTPDIDTVIEVSSPIVTDQAAHVCAVGIPLRAYYRMDAVIEPGQTLNWPLGDVIYPAGFLAGEIGLFGWIGETERIYLPVLAVMPGNPVPVESVIQLCLRTSANVEFVQWRFAEIENGSRSELSGWIDAEPSTYLAGKPISIILPSSKTGKLYVEVAARDKKRPDRWLQKALRVIVTSADTDEQKNQ